MSTSVGRRVVDPPQNPSADPTTHEAVLAQLQQAFLVIDEANLVAPPVSPAAAALLRAPIRTGSRLQDLFKPLAGDKSLALILDALMRAQDAAVVEHVELRLPRADNSLETVRCRVEFRGLARAGDAARCLIVLHDETAELQQAHELEDLRREVQIQSEILRSVLRMGRTRFASSVQKTDRAMTAIDGILKKPAREQAAFRNKLEETLEEVDRIRREGAALKLTSLERSARAFEDALHGLRGRATLSGSDFLPLAVKMDELYGQFALLRSLTKNVQAPAPAAAARAQRAAPLTDNGTQIIDAPQFIKRLRDARARPKPVGGLEGTLASLTAHIAAEHGKSVRLECEGLDDVPAAYQGTVKNVTIQLIRNAIMHGIETPDVRAAAGKPSGSTLKLSFRIIAGGGFELRFQDDGRGVDPDLVRRIAVERRLLSAEEAAVLPERQAIKLIFKAGFTTLPQPHGGPPHGAGLSLTRRYVDEAGGKIALASEAGISTRFKISLPLLADAGRGD